MKKIKKKEVIPYNPIPYRKGCTVIKKYVLPFEDKAGNKADITYVDYKDKKGKLIEKYTLYIKWH